MLFSHAGEKLLPDYFLDEAEDFQQEWLQSKQKTGPSATSSSDTASGSTASSSSSDETPAALFDQVKTVLSSEVVGQIKATYLFVLDGDHPGM